MTAATDTRPAVCSQLDQLARGATAARASETIRTLPGAAQSGDARSDAALMTQVAQGDRHAIGVLLERYQLVVYRFALRLTGNGASAEDIVSEVFLELWRHAARFEGRARLSTWILAIARNKAVSSRRGRSEEPLDDAMAQAIPDETSTAEQTVDAAKRSAVLRQCLAQLSAAHREIIDLVYYHEKSVEEVAAIVGAGAATVKTRMFYARRRLAELLKAAGVETVHCW
jgi:RNA polymerase sigma-70 factor (ECF subfamily)